MLRARIKDEADGTASAIIGLTRANIVDAVMNQKPLVIPLSDLGIPINLVVIVRDDDDALLEAVNSDNPDGAVVIDETREHKAVAEALYSKVMGNPLLKASYLESLKHDPAGNAEPRGNRASRRSGNPARRNGKR